MQGLELTTVSNMLCVEFLTLLCNDHWKFSGGHRMGIRGMDLGVGKGGCAHTIPNGRYIFIATPDLEVLAAPNYSSINPTNLFMSSTTVWADLGFELNNNG